MAHQASVEQQQTCALRALSLCDGQRVEMPDRSLASCLCWLEERAEEASYALVAKGCRAQRVDLISRALTASEMA